MFNAFFGSLFDSQRSKTPVKDLKHLRSLRAYQIFKKALPGGHIWRGKHRLYKKVTPEHLARLKKSFELEEKNMFYLRHPYLTPEESHGHVKGLNKHEQFIAKHNEEKIKNWKSHKYLGDRFGFLKVADAWE